MPLKVVAAEAVKTANVTAAENGKKAVNIGTLLNVGNNIQVTSTFLGSVRANAVPGREGTKGMNMVGYSRDGKASIFL
jgi:hypothetical protein